MSLSPTDRLRATSRALQRALLGAAITTRGACLVDLLAEGLTETHFTVDELSALWCLIIDRDDKGLVIEQRAIENSISMSADPRRYGPGMIVGEVCAAASADPIHDARELVALGVMHAIHTHGQHCLNAYKQGVPAGSAAEYVDTLLEQVVASVNDLDHTPAASQEDAGVMSDRLGAALDASEDPQTRPVPISTGIEALDNLFRPQGSRDPAGLVKRELVVIGARPGAGKTALAENLTLNIGAQGHGVSFASCDMSPEQLRGRMLAKLARSVALHNDPTTPPARVRCPRVGQLVSVEAMSSLTDHDRALAREALHLLRPLPIISRRLLTPTIRQLRTFARQCHRQFERAQTLMRLFVVDYLDKVKGNRDDGDRRLQIAAIANALKDLTEELDITVLLLVQMNRDAERNPGGKPAKTNLKESGDIEQAADVIWLLWKRSDYDDLQADDELTVIQAKNRRDAPGREAVLGWHGPTGALFDPPLSISRPDNVERFRSAAQRRQDNEWSV